MFLFIVSSKRLQDMSSRRLQDFFSVTIFRLARRLQDVFKTFSRRLGRRTIVTLKTCWRRLQDQQMFAGLKSSFHFCSTLLLEWVSCRNNTLVDPIFSLEYCINFNLFLYYCIPPTLLVIKPKLMFGNKRSLKLWQILNL